MKLRHLLIGAILAVNPFAAIAIAALAVVSKGRPEAASSTAISGQAYNSSALDDTSDMRVSVKDRNTGGEVLPQRMTAGEYSDKLYGSGEGNGCHAPALNMNWSVLPDGVYLVEGYVGDNSFSSPRIYISSSPDAGQETPATQAQNLVPLGVFKTTGYCPCRTCSGGRGHHTCIGAVATTNHIIAVDPWVTPYGSRVMINGVVYIVENRGGAVRGNHIDTSFNTHVGIRQYDTQNAEVYLTQS